jgi:hypothetical protein
MGLGQIIASHDLQIDGLNAAPANGRKGREYAEPLSLLMSTAASSTRSCFNRTLTRTPSRVRCPVGQAVQQDELSRAVPEGATFLRRPHPSPWVTWTSSTIAPTASEAAMSAASRHRVACLWSRSSVCRGRARCRGSTSTCRLRGPSWLPNRIRSSRPDSASRCTS